MELIILALPRAWQSRAKAIVAALGAILTAVSVAVPVVPDWLSVAIAFLTALGVYRTPAPGYHYEPKHRG